MLYLLDFRGSSTCSSLESPKLIHDFCWALCEGKAFSRVLPIGILAFAQGFWTEGGGMRRGPRKNQAIWRVAMLEAADQQRKTPSTAQAVTCIPE